MNRTFASVVTALAVAAVAASTCTPAGAAPAAAPAKSPLFAATASGLSANLVGGLASTGPIAPVALTTRSTALRSATSAAGVSVSGALSTGAVTTDVSTKRNAANTATIVTGHARTVTINLLAGAIKVDAVNTSAVLTVKKAKVTGTATTTFTNLQISGHKVINGTVAPNTVIEVPGVARILLNSSSAVGGANEGMAVSTAIIVSVLGGSLTGSAIAVNSTTAQTQFVGPFYAPLNGIAFSALTTVDSDASLNVGPLGAVGMPQTGTNGQPLTATVAASNLASLGTLGAATSTAVGTVADNGSRSTMTNTILGLNLLGGLITADRVTTTADVALDDTGTRTRTASVTFSNLKIANVAIPIDVAPNTTVALPGVGGVVVRGTATTATAAAGAALTISLSTAGFGLPAGASITIGFAYASVDPTDI